MKAATRPSAGVGLTDQSLCKRRRSLSWLARAVGRGAEQTTSSGDRQKTETRCPRSSSWSARAAAYPAATYTNDVNYPFGNPAEQQVPLEEYDFGAYQR